MDKTLIIYDTEGKIWLSITGSYTIPNGIPYIEVVVPEGKRVVGVDMNAVPRTAIFEDLPETETKTLRNDIDALYAAVDFLLGV